MGKLNKDSNSYTIIYTAVMIIIVAVALAFTSQALKKPQQANERIDKMQQILRSLKQNPADKADVIDAYQSIIKREMLINDKGEIVESFDGNELGNSEVFKMNTKNQYKYYRKDQTTPLPLYEAVVDGTPAYVIPLNGVGLWGDIWGYIAIENDGYTVLGVDFSHASETPGLGAEIAHEPFSNQFNGKHIGTPETGVVGIAVVKKGRKAEGMEYVDGVTGGTLTSNGVNDMLRDCLAPYKAFLGKVANGEVSANSDNEAIN